MTCQLHQHLHGPSQSSAGTPCSHLPSGRPSSLLLLLLFLAELCVLPVHEDHAPPVAQRLRAELLVLPGAVGGVVVFTLSSQPLQCLPPSSPQLSGRQAALGPVRRLL